MSKAKVTLASSVGIASLLAGSAAHVARGEVITFQNGVNGYNGTFDRRIASNPSGDVNGANVNTNTSAFFIDGGAADVNDSGVSQALMRFDNILGSGAIPTNALIISATLDTVTTTNSNSQAGSGAYNVYRLTTAFDGTSTYASPFGGDGVYNDVGRFGGSFNRPTLGAPSSARVDRIVQDWVNGSANNGFAIRSDLTTDGWSFNTTGAGNVANRPKLTVNYTTNPDARISHYQQNVNGYNGTVDTFINGINGATAGASVFGSSVEHGFLDGSNAAGTGDSFDQPYFVKFDNIDLSAPAVTRADLVIHSGFDSANSGTGGNFSVHRILKPWDLNTSYASLDSDGDTTLTPIAELIANGFIETADADTGAIGHASVVNLDVTDIVQAWKDGAPNYGFYIGSTGTADGWEIYSSGAFGAINSVGTEVTDVALQIAPELTILYAPDRILFWDIDGSVAVGAGGATPNGNWDGTTANFNSDPLGGAAGSRAAATTADDDVIFAAGTDATGSYTVTVSGTQAAKSVAIALGNVTLAGGTVATSAFNVAAGASGTVSSVVAGGATPGLTKTGPGTLALTAANTYTGGTTVSAGTLTAGHGDAFAGGSLTVAAGATAVAQANLAKALTVSSVTTTGTGKLDLTNNAMVVKNSTLAAVQASIAAGFNSGDWLGAGITSSSAATDTQGVTALGYFSNADFGLTTFEGVAVDADDILVKYTYYGDADLGGTVNLDDFNQFLFGFQDPTAAKTWLNGDFDYSGTINLDDFNQFLYGYQNQGAALGALSEAIAAAGLSSDDRQFMQAAVAAVPEPTSLGLLGLAAAGLLGRRRRR